jgi:hypothetical protein
MAYVRVQRLHRWGTRRHFSVNVWSSDGRNVIRFCRFDGEMTKTTARYMTFQPLCTARSPVPPVGRVRRDMNDEGDTAHIEDFTKIR